MGTTHGRSADRPDAARQVPAPGDRDKLPATARRAPTCTISRPATGSSCEVRRLRSPPSDSLVWGIPAALAALAADHGVSCYGCDASDPASVAELFDAVTADLGTPTLVVHNIDGRTGDIFRKKITEVAPELVQATLQSGAYSAFLVAQQAAAGAQAS